MSARWLARSAFVLMLAAVAVLIGFAGLGGLVMVVIGVAGAGLVVAGVYTFLAHRGMLRWIPTRLPSPGSCSGSPGLDLKSSTCAA